MFANNLDANTTKLIKKISFIFKAIIRFVFKIIAILFLELLICYIIVIKSIYYELRSY